MQALGVAAPLHFPHAERAHVRADRVMREDMPILWPSVVGAIRYPSSMQQALESCPSWQGMGRTAGRGACASAGDLPEGAVRSVERAKVARLPMTAGGFRSSGLWESGSR